MSDAVPATTPILVAPMRRPWSHPALAELPKLTQLTLASAIGGGGGTGGGGSTVFALLLGIGLLAGCGAGEGTGGPGEAPAPVLSQVVTCTVDRAAATMSCAGPDRAASIIGGQGKLIGLRSSNVSYDGGGDVLSADVTVENLSIQPIGTTDGTTIDGGIDVFFAAGPTGAVTVDNPTGTGTFTASGQHFFHYNTLLARGQSSLPLTWEFAMNGEASFTFSVLISAKIPASDGILAWVTIPELSRGGWTSVTGYGSDMVMVAGLTGEVVVNNGFSWISRYDIGDDGSSGGSDAIAAVSPTELYRYSSMTFQLRQYDGGSWRNLSALPGAPGGAFESMQVMGPGDLYVFNGDVYRFHDGVWSNVTHPPFGALTKSSTKVGGVIYMATSAGAIWTFDGTTWTSIGNSGINNPDAIAATGTSDIWVYNGFDGAGLYLRHWDGTSWSTVTPPADYTTGWFGRDIASTVPGEAYIAGYHNSGSGFVWYYDGTGWTTPVTAGDAFFSIWARSASSVYVAGSEGRVKHWNGSIWEDLLTAVPAGKGVYVASQNDIWVTRPPQKSFLHWDGSAWTAVASPDSSEQLRALWGSSGSDVWALTSGYAPFHYDGVSWSVSEPLTNYNSYPIGHGGSGPNDVWFVGFFSFAHWTGSSFSEVTNPTAEAFYDVMAFSPTDAFTVGNNGTILRWDGISWTPMTSGTSANFRTIWGSSNTDVWAFADDGTARHWDGATWSDGGLSQTFLGFSDSWGTPSGLVYAVGATGVAKYWNGSSWSDLPISASPNIANSAISGDGNVAMIVGERFLRGIK